MQIKTGKVMGVYCENFTENDRKISVVQCTWNFIYRYMCEQIAIALYKGSH